MQTNLRKVGGSVMVALSPALLQELKIGAGSAVDLAVNEGHLVMLPIRKPRYKLTELLAQCDARASLDDADSEWLGAPPVGKELF